MRSSSSLVIPAALILASTSACATLAQAIAKPSVRFDDAKLTAISLGGVTVDFHLVVDNPNPIGLRLDAVDATLFVEGKQLVSGAPPLGIELRPSGESQVVIPAEIKFADLASVVATFLTKQTAAYRLEGSVGVRSPAGLVQLPFAKEGTFPVPKLPEIALGSPRVRDIGISGAALDVPLRITNTNALPLPLDRLRGALRIAGAQVASVSLESIGALEPGAPKELVVPITIGLAESAAAIGAIRSGRARIDLSAELESGGATIPLQISETVDVVSGRPIL